MTTATAPQRLRETTALEAAAVLREADAPDGVVVFKDVAILGLVSSNSDDGHQRTYEADAVKAAAPLYEGARSYINHTTWTENGADRDLHRLLGEFKAVRYDEATNKLRGDLHALVTPSTQHVITLMERMPHRLALSHDVQGLQNEDGVVHAITTVHSVDVVPVGGTNQNLYEAGNPAATTENPDMTTKTNDEADKALKEAQDQAKESARREAAAESRAMVADALLESGLPKESVAKLRPLLEGQDADTIAKAIKAEADHLASLQETAGKPNPVTGAGATADDEGGEDTKLEEAAKVEADITSMIDQHLGLTQEEN